MPPFLKATFMQSTRIEQSFIHTSLSFPMSPNRKKTCVSSRRIYQRISVFCQRSPVVTNPNTAHPPLLSPISFIASKHCLMAGPKEDSFPLKTMTNTFSAAEIRSTVSTTKSTSSGSRYPISFSLNRRMLRPVLHLKAVSLVWFVIFYI